MKCYYVVEIECGKDTKLSEIYAFIEQNFKYSRRLFEIGNIDISSINSKKIKSLAEAYDFERFSYEYRLRDYYRPTPIISNLSDRVWMYGNSSNNENPSIETFSGVIEFCQNLKSTMCNEYMIGFDEITWAEEKAPEGTYGYEKPNATIFQGSRYLSNSVIVTKSFVEKPNLIVYVSFESRFKELDCIKQLITFLGKIKNEKMLFAPSDENEREVWEEAKAAAKLKAERFNSIQPDLISNLPYTIQKPAYDPYRAIPYTSEKINIRKLEKNMLCYDGWELKNNDPHFRTTVTRKIIDGIEYKMWIDTLHGGHYLQLWFSCCSPMFEIPVNCLYSAEPIDEEQAILFIKNAAYLRDKFIETMT